jgi:hypothetical protein
MSGGIERLRYYDREYLRSFDLEAEQRYHVEMRRRLNLALHLSGIVDGLGLRQDTVAQGAPPQFSIGPGMAIDEFGREIVVFESHPIDDADFRGSRISGSGTFQVWLAYASDPTTPPAPGYAVCDLKGQYTRTRESYRVVISNSPGKGTPPSYYDPPADDSDDPNDASFILLGKIIIGLDAGGSLAVTSATSEGRTYAGLRAQRVIAPSLAPPQPPAAPAGDPVLDLTKPVDPPVSIDVQATVFAGKNLIVGDNFAIPQAKIKPTPAGAFPKANGNVKVAGDLFLQGTLYGLVTDQWLGLGEYLKSFIPEVVVGVHAVAIAPGAANPTTGTEPIPVTTTLPKVSRVQMAVSISGVTWQNLANLTTWSKGSDQSDFVTLDVQVGDPGPPAAKTYTFPVNWTVGPRQANPSPPPTNFLYLTNLNLMYIAVFTP